MKISSLTPASSNLAARTAWLTALLGSFVFVASVASAQDVRAYEPPGVDISRDADSLPDEIRPDTPRPVVADTIISFTNASRNKNVVGCTAINKNGQKVGSQRAGLPPLGLRYIRVSDLTDQRPFVGSVLCKSLAPARPVALFLGPEFSDLPVNRSHHNDMLHYRVPLAVTY